MKRIFFSTICLLILMVSACSDGNDYRDVYVGDYVGSGYSGVIVVIGTGVSRDILSQNGVISVSKDKSSIDRLNIEIGDQTFSAFINGSGLSIDQTEYDLTGDTPGYTFKVYQTGTGTITPTTINLQFQYSGTAKYDPDPNDPAKIRYYEIGGTGMANGTK